MSDHGFDLSVVVPAYQEAPRIAATVERLQREVAAAGRRVEVLVVDDGSTDRTAATAREAGADQVIQMGSNCGKGAAVRAGMLAATGSVRAFIDADLAYTPAQLLGIVSEVEQGADAAVGNRRLAPGGSSGPILRRLGGAFISLVTSWLVLGNRRDSQCGIKAFDGAVAMWVFTRARIDGFGFDVEVLHLLDARGATVVEVPVTARASDASSVHVFRDGVRLLVDLAVIRYRSRRGDYADGDVRVSL